MSAHHVSSSIYRPAYRTYTETRVVMGGTLGSFFKPEKNLEFFRLKNDPRDAAPGRLE